MKPFCYGPLLRAVFEVRDPSGGRSLQCITAGVERGLDLNIKSKSVQSSHTSL